ncbi:MAG: hypothetical protein ACSLEN_14410 [Candidatus Malihini olakiniferum]
MINSGGIGAIFSHFVPDTQQLRITYLIDSRFLRKKKLRNKIIPTQQISVIVCEVFFSIDMENITYVFFIFSVIATSSVGFFSAFGDSVLLLF